MIELLVVIAIIGLLSTLAVVALNTARVKARDAKRLADLHQLQTALELYYNDQNGYPPAAQPITLGKGSAACLDSAGFGNAGCSNNPYLSIVPSDPLQSGSYIYSVVGSSYSVSASLEGTVNNLGPGNIHLTPAGIGP